jgi:diacylglycerol kinase (ATP)
MARISIIKKRLNSFNYALQGLKIFLSTQPNAIIHLFASIAVVIAGFWFKISINEWLAIVFAVGLVLMAECFNTSIEFLVNLVCPEHNELAGKVKDLSAAAVLIASVCAAVIGAVVFLPYLIKIFG